MGCDIHATLEYKQFDSWWDFAVEVEIDRGYYFFTILNGVRDQGVRPIIAKNRGIPKDVSYPFTSQYEEWGADAHSPSWATFKELSEWKPENPEVLNFDATEFRNELFYKVMKLLADKYGEENVRLVFFYGN